LAGQRYRLDVIKALFHFTMKNPGSSPVDEGRQANSKQRYEEFFPTMTCDRTVGGCHAPKEWWKAFALLMKGPSRLPANYEPPNPTASELSDVERANLFVSPILAAIKTILLSGFGFS
jgi:hypothetical protein